MSTGGARVGGAGGAAAQPTVQAMYTRLGPSPEPANRSPPSRAKGGWGDASAASLRLPPHSNGLSAPVFAWRLVCRRKALSVAA